jgi:hypothetical protein
VYWNATTQQAIYFGDERHGITLDWQTHEYLHRTRGAAIANGFLASGYTLNNSATDAATQIAIESGTFFDEDMKIDIVSTATPTAGTYQQNLLFPAKIPVLHLQGTSWVMDAPTDFPFKQGTSRPQYNSVSGGVWSTADVGNNQHATTWILATNNLTYPVIAIIGQSATDNLGEAEAFSFADLTLTGFPSVEFRPLYKLIYKASNGYENSVNAQLVSIIDLRSISAVGSAANPATDHGNLSGLSDDDHPQYVHTSEVRTPSAAVKNSFFPSQVGQTGKFLSTDGTNTVWEPPPSGSLSFTGDVTGSGSTGSSVAMTLAASGVVAGQYTKVTVDSKGRVTAGTGVTSADVTSALGYTPYNATNPAGYTTNVGTVTSVSGTGTVSGLTLTGSVTSSGSLVLGGTLTLTSGQVTTALGYTPYNSTNPSGYISGITSGMVTTALGYTPYNSTNPSGYITSSALSSYLPLSGGAITGQVTITSTLAWDDATPALNVGGTGQGRIQVRHIWGKASGSAATDHLWLQYDNSSKHVQIGKGGGSNNLYVSGNIYTNGYFGGNLVLNAGNYNSYAPTLTGTGASGTWAINVTGNAATTSQRNFGSDIATAGQGRFTGWYDGGSGNNALALEVGVSGGAGYVLSYNRGTSTYATLALAGSNIQLGTQGGTLTGPSGNVILHAGNYTSYSPSLTGSGASGTWSINVTGSAGSASSAGYATYNQILDTRAAQYTPSNYQDYRATYEFTDKFTGLGDWHTAMTLQGWHDGYTAWQIIGPASTSAHENWYLRSGVNSSWNSLRSILHSGNYGSYSTFGGKVTSAGNNGFANDVYYGAARNPIWSFGNASSYGISYYQGAAGVGGGDTIGFSVNGTTSATSNNFAIANGASYVNNNVILHAGNYTSYAPSLGGSGASGTWGITASSANKTNANGGYARVGYGMAPFYNWGGTNGGSGAPSDSTYTTGIDVGSHPSDQAYGFQIASNMWNVGLWTRTYNSGFSGWVRLLDSSNYTSYAPSLTGSGASGTWGINISGSAAQLNGYASSESGGGSVVLRTASNGYLYLNNWINTASAGLFSSVNGAHWYPNNGSYGAWKADGSRNGWGGIEFPGSTTAVSLMIEPNGDTVGFHANSYGWKFRVAGGTAYVGKNYWGANEATILDSSNYTSYALPLSGGTVTGTLTLNSTLNANDVINLGYNINGSIATSARRGIELHNSGGTDYWIGKRAGAWTQPLDVSFYTGIRYHAHQAYGGHRFYTGGYDSTYSFSVGDGDSNVRVYTSLYVSGDSRGTDVYTTGGWFRNHTNNNGIYWSNTAWHLYPSNANDFYIRSGSNESSLSFLKSDGGVLGYVHFAADLACGFLTNGRGWRFRVDNSGNARCYNNLYLDQNYGHGHVGLYESTRYQGVFFMGDSYKMSADGTSLANMYGIGWSHPNAGGAAGNLTDHGMLIINNGSFRCAISNSIVASGNITAYSDERLKRNWRDMPENFVERLAQVRVGCYERIDDGTQQVGVSAQSLQPLLPEAIQIAKDEIGTLSVSYGNAAMASAVELAKELVMLKKELAEIKSRLH